MDLSIYTYREGETVSIIFLPSSNDVSTNRYFLSVFPPRLFFHFNMNLAAKRKKNSNNTNETKYKKIKRKRFIYDFIEKVGIDQANNNMCVVRVGDVET